MSSFGSGSVVLPPTSDLQRQFQKRSSTAPAYGSQSELIERQKLFQKLRSVSNELKRCENGGDFSRATTLKKTAREVNAKLRDTNLELLRGAHTDQRKALNSTTMRHFTELDRAFHEKERTLVSSFQTKNARLDKLYEAKLKLYESGLANARKMGTPYSPKYPPELLHDKRRLAALVKMKQFHAANELSKRIREEERSFDQNFRQKQPTYGRKQLDELRREHKYYKDKLMREHVTAMHKLQNSRIEESRLLRQKFKNHKEVLTHIQRSSILRQTGDKSHLPMQRSLSWLPELNSARPMMEELEEPLHAQVDEDESLKETQSPGRSFAPGQSFRLYW